MSAAKCPKCGGVNVLRLNPLEKIPKWKCLAEQCKNRRPFIMLEDRVAVCIAICKDDTKLRNVDDEVGNERLFDFWAVTDSFGKILKAFIDENDPDFYRRVTPHATVDRDFRPRTKANPDGLNNTYRKEHVEIKQQIRES